MGSPSTSTRFIDSLGTSAVAATRCLVTLLNTGGQLLLDGVANLTHRNPVQDLAEKPLDQHPLGHRVRDAAALEVEEVFGIDGADRRSMAAAQDVIVQDLEDWLRGCLRLLREQQVAVRLVG